MNSDTPSQSGQSTVDAHVAIDLAERLRDLLAGLRDADVERFLAAWPAALQARAMRSRDVPVTRWLGAPTMRTADFAARFVAGLTGAAAHLEWRQSYGAGQAGDAFLENYAYCELLGALAAVTSARLAAGVLLLGPDTEYAAHWHEAEEIYVPLAGAACWWQGVQGWRRHPPGSVIRHARFEPHAMRTTDQPLLALYLWRSENLAQKAQLVARPAR